MDKPVKLIVGLGNPGPEYERTRHNAGAWFIEELVRRNNGSLKQENKFFGLTGRLTLANQDIRLLIPTTFMNRSGQAVGALASFYNIPPESILVAHDELDLEPGSARFKRGGGHGGHNGLRDIIARLANQNTFLRLRIGIGHPGHKSRVTGHVLGRAPQDEQILIDQAIEQALTSTEILLREGLAPAMNRLHSFNAAN